jgi:hypothetical protein
MAAKPEVIEAQKKLAYDYMHHQATLTNLGRQEAYIAFLHQMTPPCWSCGKPTGYLDAVKEDYDPETYRGEEEQYSCPHCGVEMIYAVPFFAQPAPWFWGNPLIYGKKET